MGSKFHTNVSFPVPKPASIDKGRNNLLAIKDNERVSVTIGHESAERNTTNTWFIYNYCLPDNISTATFEYAGNTYEVF